MDFMGGGAVLSTPISLPGIRLTWIILHQSMIIGSLLTIKYYRLIFLIPLNVKKLSACPLLSWHTSCILREWTNRNNPMTLNFHTQNQTSLIVQIKLGNWKNALDFFFDFSVVGIRSLQIKKKTLSLDLSIVMFYTYSIVSFCQRKIQWLIGNLA